MLDTILDIILYGKIYKIIGYSLAKSYVRLICIYTNKQFSVWFISICRAADRHP